MLNGAVQVIAGALLEDDAGLGDATCLATYAFEPIILADSMNSSNWTNFLYLCILYQDCCSCCAN